MRSLIHPAQAPDSGACSISSQLALGHRRSWRAAVAMAAAATLAFVLLAGFGHRVHGAADAPASITVDYPLNQSVFPPDMEPPTFQWRDGSDRATTWRIDVTFAGRRPGTAPDLRRAPHAGRRNRPALHRPDQQAARTHRRSRPPRTPGSPTPPPGPRCGSTRSKAAPPSPSPATPPATPASRSRAARCSCTISRDPVGAPIFYRDVPLMPSATEKGVIKPLAESAVPLDHLAHARRGRIRAATS